MDSLVHDLQKWLELFESSKLKVVLGNSINDTE